MISVKVNWHAQCPDCGTQLAVDYFEDLYDCTVCPWCGRIYKIERGPDQAEMKAYIAKVIRELESRANALLPA